MLSSLLDLVLPPAMVVLAGWFYPHCTRPALAFASAPRLAFSACLLTTAAVMVGCALITLDQVAFLFRGSVLPGSLYRPITAVVFIMWLFPAVGFLRPRWFRFLGRADATAAPRWLLTVFRREWKRWEGDRQRIKLVGMLEPELEKVREPSNAALIDEWIQLLDGFIRASRSGHASTSRAIHAVQDRLETVVPLDPLARWV